MLNVIFLSINALNVVMMNAVMLKTNMFRDIMMNVVVLRLVGPISTGLREGWLKLKKNCKKIVE